ncbi:pilus assembly PilX family protein [Uliginosibacterium gangwonense]|uniref:pilus assembly PilX family protein n=1 Tax=Uliginosibacterium gangwonense TaxID=392736 RepID=UPI0003AA9B32|nr:hypothetical protein [Uliginosibacterium gangwonense]
MNMPKKLSISGRRAAQQRGISILITLVALTVLMFSAVALVRSFSASTLMAGSVAFKRSSISVGERGFNRAMFSLTDGISITDFSNDAPSAHYFASIKQSNDDSRGIPKVLLSETAFTAAGMDHSKDFSSNESSSEKITYVIERQCTKAGDGDSSYCANPVITGSLAARRKGANYGTDYKWPSSGGSKNGTGGGGAGWPMRVTVRVQDSVTNQVTYLQSTVLLQ